MGAVAVAVAAADLKANNVSSGKKPFRPSSTVRHATEWYLSFLLCIESVGEEEDNREIT